MAAPQSFRFIINPLAGHGEYPRVIRAIQKILSGPRVKYQIKILEYKGQADSIARQFSGPDHVVVAVGGDGTVNEVLNGIIGSQSIFGIIPAGTGNGFARELGLPLRRRKKACKVLLSGCAKEIDVGVANGRYFFGVAGVGFDALISKFAGRKIGFLRGMWLYFLAGILVFYRYKPPLMTVEIDSEVFQVKPLLIAVANTRRYGGRAVITPYAVPDDGLLDVCIIRKMSAFHLLRHLRKLFRGKHANLSEVTMHRGKNITIKCDEPIPIHVDGEAVDNCCRVDFSILPKAIRVLVPQSS